MSLFNSFDPGHADLVTVTKFNFYGNRLLTASADHRIKVWDLQKDGSWTLIDAWRGHDAEIRDVRSKAGIPLHRTRLDMQNILTYAI